MKILDLFSGIGGFSLGLERAGMQTVAFCEVDPVCRQVLKKHWPDVPIFEDVKTLSVKDIHDTIDVICGGFPCQDISFAGKGAGLAGERSGLWYEYHRLIEEIRPRYVIIENVAALRSRGLDEVLRCLAALGYDAEWHCIPAKAVGAPHQRDRVWIVAYSNNSGSGTPKYGVDTVGSQVIQERQDESFSRVSGCGQTLAYSSSLGLQGQKEFIKPQHSTAVVNRKAVESQYNRVSHLWSIEPAVGRVANGVSGRVDRLKQLGNAVVPQIPELIGRAILGYENTLA
jgi:DNA (cytosine-5)-methyltransferase 1